MSCLQAIDGEDAVKPFSWHIINLPWASSDKGTCARFCWVPIYCGIEGNVIVDLLGK